MLASDLAQNSAVNASDPVLRPLPQEPRDMEVDREIVQEALPPGCVVVIEPGEPNLGIAEAARRIWHQLEASGRLDGSQSPLTGGAGI